MKHLLPFRVYEARASVLTPDQEAFLNEYTDGTWSVNRQTGLVDVKGGFDCSKPWEQNLWRELESLQGVSFGHVSGDFSCERNQLTTLVGAPQTVDKNFNCHSNGLTTLDGAPQTVNWNFSCHFNQLTTLEGAPQTVGGSFVCNNNKLTTLEGAPQTVGGAFFCHENLLTSLEGAPQTGDGLFSCYDNRLTTLVGAPQTVNGYFNCCNNKLTTLEGAPRTVGGNFFCSDNQLTSLVGAPQAIDGVFDCDAFRIELGEWNPSGWLKVLTTGNAAAQKLILTLPYLQPDWWNSELQRDPGKTINLLAPWWKYMPEKMKSQIVIPPGYEDEFGLFSGFDELGLF